MKVYISGTSRGIGHALAKYYLNQGCEVYGISRSTTDLNINHIQCDLTDTTKLKDEISKQLNNINNLDLIILNAGVLGEISLLKDASLKDMKNTMEINLWSQKVLLDLLMQYTPENVIAISSGAAIKGTQGWSGYSLSKAALNMLIQLYASENPSTKFIALAPGLVDTNMQEIISTIDHIKFPNFKRIQDARNTQAMPSPESFIDIYQKNISKILNSESGSFIDIRNFN